MSPSDNKSVKVSDNPVTVKACVPLVFKFRGVFLLFRYHLPLEKDVTLHLNKLEFPLLRSLVEISSMVLEKKMKM